MLDWTLSLVCTHNTLPALIMDMETLDLTYSELTRPGNMSAAINVSDNLASRERTLYQVIADAQPGRLRRALLTLCSTSMEITSLVRSLLLLDDIEIRHDGVDGDDTLGDGFVRQHRSDPSEPEVMKEDTPVMEKSDETMVPSPHALKRRLARFATCKNCNEEFDVTASAIHSGTGLRPRNA